LFSGGLGGAALKPVALANVRQFRRLLRPDIDLVGCGGVQNGRDAFEFLVCGASAVQVATCHQAEGPACFERIATELGELLRSKGYRSLDEFRWRLVAEERLRSLL
jgi:dihydroorotate dehydrogenase (fumarate)